MDIESDSDYDSDQNSISTTRPRRGNQESRLGCTECKRRLVGAIFQIGQEFRFPQFFHLHPEGDKGAGAYYLANDVHRLAHGS